MENSCGGHGGRDEERHRPNSINSSLEELADFCLATGELSTAIEYYTRALAKADPVSSPSKKASLLRRLATCYSRIGKCDHALELLDKAFALVADGEDPFELARIIGERGWVHFKRGEYDLSEADLQAGIDILMGDEKAKAVAQFYNRLGGVYYRKGDPERAMELYRAALAMARLLGERQLVGTCLNNLGLVCKSKGRWLEAKTFFEDALKVAEDIGQHFEKATRLSNLGIVHSKLGDWRKAYRCWTQALDIFMSIGNRWESISVYIALGNYYLTYRDFERAEEYYVRAMKESSDNGDARSAALSFEAMGDLHHACGRLDSANRCYHEALEIAAEIAPRSDIVIEVKRRLADLEISRGNFAEALELATQAIDLANQIGDIFERACAIRSRSCAQFHLKEWEQARNGFEKAIEIFAGLGCKKELALTYLVAGELLVSQSGLSKLAASYLSMALPLFEEIGMTYEAGLATLGLGRIAAAKGDVEACHKLLDRVTSAFDQTAPTELWQAIQKIGAEADESVARLSVSEANDLASFNEIVGKILATRDDSQRMKLVLEGCLDKTVAERGAILVGTIERLEAVANLGIPSEDLPETSVLVRRLAEASGSYQRPVVSASLKNDVRFTFDEIDGIGDRAAVCVPVRLGDAEIAFIYLDAPGRKVFSRSQIEFVVAMAGILKTVISEAKLGRYVEETRYLRSKLKDSKRIGGLITQNRKMLEIIDAIQFLCHTSTTVLIEGETGTGKEMLARAIHASGERKSKPFVTIDCSALANDIIESELFGHVKGAFTDAKTGKKGLFEEAHGGTVFLDEIDKTSRKFQQRLLQVVDKREFKPVGSTVWRKIDFRLICATNRDLAEEVRAGRFLEDLYYRLKVISLKIPPLRERRDDIPLLAEHFLEVYNKRLGKSVVGFTSAAMDLLVSYSWPGNVRQLEHEIERAVTFCRDGNLITPELFSDEVTEWRSHFGMTTVKPIAKAVEEVEKALIREAMRRFGGNKTKVAKSLGLSRRGLLNKLHRYRIEA